MEVTSGVFAHSVVASVQTTTRAVPKGKLKRKRRKEEKEEEKEKGRNLTKEEEEERTEKKSKNTTRAVTMQVDCADSPTFECPVYHGVW